MFERDFLHHGVPINNLWPNEALQKAGQLILQRRTSHLVTLTIAMYTAGRDDHSFRETLSRADLVIPESTGLRLYTKLQPPTFVRTPGGNLARSIVAFCAETDKRVALIGALPDKRNKAAQVISSEHPGIDIVAVPGEYQFTNITDSNWICAKLDELEADFVVMAGTGVDAVEWIDRNIVLNQLSVGLVGNFGQTIDVWSGLKRTPPRWAHRYGIEWLMRMPLESSTKNQRYLRDLCRFGNMVISDLISKDRSHPSSQHTFSN